jgi:hypothetical protein
MMLQRKPLEVAPESECDNMELAQEADRLLNYPCYREHLNARRDSDLVIAMRKMQLDPFTPQSVEVYKERATKALRRKNSWVRWTELLPAFFLLSAVSAYVLFAITAITHSNLSLVMFAITASASVGIVVLALRTRNLRVREFAWRQIPLGEYRKPIPEFALQTAVDLKRACPRAMLNVEELQTGSPKADPFLTVFDPQTQRNYYLEVWDEPSFSKERQIL